MEPIAGRGGACPSVVSAGGLDQLLALRCELDQAAGRIDQQRWAVGPVLDRSSLGFDLGIGRSPRRWKPSHFGTDGQQFRRQAGLCHGFVRHDVSLRQRAAFWLLPTVVRCRNA